MVASGRHSYISIFLILLVAVIAGIISVSIPMWHQRSLPGCSVYTGLFSNRYEGDSSCNSSWVAENETLWMKYGRYFQLIIKNSEILYPLKYICSEFYI